MHRPSISRRMRPPLLSSLVRTRSCARARIFAHEKLGAWKENFAFPRANILLSRRGLVVCRRALRPARAEIMGFSFMAYLVDGVAPVTPALGVAVSPVKPSASSLRPMESILAAG